MVIRIQGGSVCAGGEHRIVTTDKGSFAISNAEIQAAIPEGGDIEAIKTAFIIVARHLYLGSRAAGRTHNQALADLVGVDVRV